jgi:hypothetical protein
MSPPSRDATRCCYRHGILEIPIVARPLCAVGCHLLAAGARRPLARSAVRDARRRTPDATARERSSVAPIVDLRVAGLDRARDRRPHVVADAEGLLK